jgi:hypothetical protein
VQQALQSIKNHNTAMMEIPHIFLNRTRFLLIIGFLLLIPIFVSISSNEIIFDRKGGYIYSDLYVSIPFSLLLLIYMSFKMRFFPIRSKFFISIFFFGVFLFLLSFILHQDIDKNLFKNLIYLILFFYTFTLMKEFFRLTLTNKSLIMNYQANFVLIPGLLILLISILSFYLIGQGFFMSKWFVIYSFEQYFVMAMLPIIALALSYSKVVWSFATAGYFMLAYFSDNDTAFIIGILLVLFQCFVKPIFALLSIRRYQILIVLMFIVGIFSPLLINHLYYNADLLWFLGHHNSYENADNLFYRVRMIEDFFDEIGNSIFFPFFSNVKPIYGDYHNEFIVIFRAIGVFALIYYLWIYKMIVKISNQFIDVKIALSLLVFVAAIMVTPSLHPYTGIYISTLFAFYRRLTDLSQVPE